MENSNSLKNFKSKITYENKTTYGAAIIIIGFIIWGITHEFFGLFIILLVTIPSILLIIPNENIRNNKFLGIILALVILFIILSCIIEMDADYSYYYFYYGEYSLWSIKFYDILLLIHCMLNLVSCYMLTVPTRKVETDKTNNISKTNVNSQNNFCKYCGNELDKDAKFCPSCGKEL